MASSTLWSPTRRVLTLATARAGITVFAPSPTKPPLMPCTSSVGRGHTRPDNGTPGPPTRSPSPLSLSAYSFASTAAVAAVPPQRGPRPPPREQRNPGLAHQFLGAHFLPGIFLLIEGQPRPCRALLGRRRHHPIVEPDSKS